MTKRHEHRHAQYKESEIITTRREAMSRWQREWDTDTDGNWTHKLIPNVSRWAERRFGEVDFHLT